MIFHNCIECDEFEMLPIADKCPAFQRYECPKCKTIQWIYHSRFNPQTFSEDCVIVDEKKKSIELKEPYKTKLREEIEIGSELIKSLNQ